MTENSEIQVTTGMLFTQAAFLLLIAVAAGYFLHGGLALSQLSHGLEPHLWAFGLGAALSVPWILISCLADLLRAFRGLPASSVKLTPCSTGTSLLRAFSAGFAEELLLRGVIQALLGIWFASAIFGLLHIGSQKWTAFYIFLRGLGYGFLYIYTGSLWVPIVMHTLNDLVAMDETVQGYLVTYFPWIDPDRYVKRVSSRAQV